MAAVRTLRDLYEVSPGGRVASKTQKTRPKRQAPTKPPHPASAQVPVHQVASMVSESGLRLLTDEILQVASPRLHNVPFLDVNHASGRVAAALRHVTGDFRLASSHVAVGEDHVLWRVKGDVEIGAEYEYNIRCLHLTDSGTGLLKIKNLAVTLKIVEDVSDGDLRLKVVEAERPTPEPRVEFERLELNISSSGNVFKKGICKIGASIFRRSISNWLLKEARSHVAGVLNDAGVGVARRWSQEIDVGLGAWAVEVDLDRRLEFRIGSGVVFGGKLGLDGGSAVGFGGNEKKLALDEALKQLPESHGIVEHFCLFLQEGVLNFVHASLWEKHVQTRLAFDLERHSASLVAALDLPENSRPKVSIYLTEAPRVALSRQRGMRFQGEACIEVRADANDLKRYPGDAIYFRVNYAFGMRVQPIHNAVNIRGGNVQAVFRFDDFQGTAAVESVRVPGLCPESKDFEALRSSIVQLVTKLGDEAWTRFQEETGGVAELGDWMPNLCLQKIGDFDFRLDVFDSLLVLKTKVDLKEDLAETILTDWLGTPKMGTRT